MAIILSCAGRPFEAQFSAAGVSTDPVASVDSHSALAEDCGHAICIGGSVRNGQTATGADGARSWDNGYAETGGGEQHFRSQGAMSRVERNEAVSDAEQG